MRRQIIAEQLEAGLGNSHAAHRDLVEILTFLVPSAATRADIERLLDLHGQGTLGKRCGEEVGFS